MYEERQDPTTEQVIAASGIAAAIIAGLVILFSRQRKEPTRVERISARAEALRSETTGRAQSLSKDAKGLVASAEDQARSLQKAGRKRAKKLAKSADRDLKHAGETVESEVQRLSKETKKMFDRGAKSGRKSAASAKKDVKRAGSDSAATIQGIVAHAVASALAGAGRARESGAHLADDARDRMPQWNRTAEKAGSDMVASIRRKVEDDVVPSLRDVALQAASLATEMWQSARERVSDNVPVESVTQRAAKAVGIGGDRAKGASSTVSDKAGEIRDRAKDASRRTAGATVHTTKDSGALLFWAGAAAALIFYVLLDQERRDQLTRSAQAATTQVQELVRDFQGYDDEF